MTEIAAIVEGHGEVASLPILIHRIARRVAPGIDLRIVRPTRVHRQQVVKPGRLEHYVETVAKFMGSAGRILILLDSNGDCPKELAGALRRRAELARSDRRIRVVLAKMEYEAWFVASADSLVGHCDIDPSTTAVDHAESIRNAKGWLSRRMSGRRRYNPKIDQPTLTRVFDLDAARTASSFDKLWRDVHALLRD